MRKKVLNILYIYILAFIFLKLISDLFKNILAFSINLLFLLLNNYIYYKNYLLSYFLINFFII